MNWRPPICCLLSYISLPRPVSKPRYGASEIQLQLQSSLIGINNQDLLPKDTDFYPGRSAPTCRQNFVHHAHSYLMSLFNKSAQQTPPTSHVMKEPDPDHRATPVNKSFQELSPVKERDGLVSWVPNSDINCGKTEAAPRIVCSDFRNAISLVRISIIWILSRFLIVGVFVFL